MKQEEFVELVHKLDEMLTSLDSLRREIGKCGGQCRGLEAINEEGLCPICSDIFEKVVAEDERLRNDREFEEHFEDAESCLRGR